MDLRAMVSDWLTAVATELLADPEAVPRDGAGELVSLELEEAWSRLGRSVDDVLRLVAGAGVLTRLQAPGGGTGAAIASISQELTMRLEADETLKFAVAVLNVAREGTVGATAFGGWQVWLPDASDLASLAPVPSTADSALQHVWPFRTDLHSRVVLLRTIPEPTRMPRGVLLTFDWRQAPWVDAWRPLLLFNLFVPDTAVHATQYGTIYEGYGGHLRGELPTEPYSHDGETYEERPLTGPWTESGGPGGDFGRFARLLDDSIEDLRGDNRRRFEQAAKRFLTASASCWPDATVPPDLEGQLIADYVSVLESLTVTGRGLLAHKTAQHVAVLCADESDDKRVRLFRLVKKAYGARSEFAHGAEVSDLPELHQLRRLVQQVLVRFAVVTAAGAAGTSLAEELPVAVMSPSYRQVLIDEPAAAFSSALAGCT